jgi:hypothetical protein
MPPINPIIGPTLPWAIVCCYMDGTHPDPGFLSELRDLFITNPASLSSYFRDQSLGAIDLSQSDVFGWYPCGWNVRSTEGVFNTYPGITKSLDRPTCVAQARKVLLENVGNVMWKYRGIIAVFNFAVNGGFSGTDVAYGMNGTMSAVDWAEYGWATCRNCLSLLKPTTIGACTNPRGAIGAGPSVHVVDTGNGLAVPTDNTVLGTAGGFSPCSKCDCMYDAAAAQAGVTCAGGGQHTPATSTPYYMLAWKNPVGGAGRQVPGSRCITSSRRTLSIPPRSRTRRSPQTAESTRCAPRTGPISPDTQESVLATISSSCAHGTIPGIARFSMREEAPVHRPSLSRSTTCRPCCRPDCSCRTADHRWWKASGSRAETGWVA